MPKHAVTMDSLEKELTESFARWDYLQEFGGSDPFWSDGVNLNLVRNRITYIKKQMNALASENAQKSALFTASYPAIYYREIPPQMDDDFMAKEHDIREYARQQINLYEKDPNFQFLLASFTKVFPEHKQTKETIKAKLPFHALVRLPFYRVSYDTDNLVDMRRVFRVPYEEKAKTWGQYADQIKSYLGQEHDTTTEKNSEQSEQLSSNPKTTSSLNQLILDAEEKNISTKNAYNSKEEQKKYFVNAKQLSLF